MVLLHTPEKQDDFTAPDFSLKNINEQTVTRDDVMGENGLVVMFICNHCPYVVAVIDRIVQTCSQLQKEGIGCVAIMANDTEKYPDDSFDNMKIFAAQNNFSFPYLIDETQETAKAYGAVCTPDFFGFDKDGVLQYRGRLDSAANKQANENTKAELFDAMMHVKNGTSPDTPQNPSMGCSIKWKTT